MISQAMAHPIPRWISRHWLGVVIAIAVVIGSSLGYLVGENRLSEERTKALSDSDMYIGVLTKARADRDGRAALDKKITGAADRTLGPSLELVDSEVRRRLNRVCEELGFSEFSVTTGTSVARGTPAKKEFKRPDERKLRDEPDFVEVQASITASGRADQVFRLLFRVEPLSYSAAPSANRSADDCGRGIARHRANGRRWCRSRASRHRAQRSLSLRRVDVDRGGRGTVRPRGVAPSCS